MKLKNPEGWKQFYLSVLTEISHRYNRWEKPYYAEWELELSKVIAWHLDRIQNYELCKIQWNKPISLVGPHEISV